MTRTRRALRGGAVLAAAGAASTMLMIPTMSASAATPLFATQTVARSSQYAPQYGTSIQLSATVGVAVPAVNLNVGGALITPSGTVAFYLVQPEELERISLQKLPSCVVLLSTCTVSFTTRGLPVGTDTVIVKYSGDSLTAPSTTSMKIVVSEAAVR